MRVLLIRKKEQMIFVNYKLQCLDDFFNTQVHKAKFTFLELGQLIHYMVIIQISAYYKCVVHIASLLEFSFYKNYEESILLLID